MKDRGGFRVTERERERDYQGVGLFDHSGVLLQTDRNAALLLGEEVSSFKGQPEKMRSAVGAPIAKEAVIEVEMTKGTLEPQLPGKN